MKTTKKNINHLSYQELAAMYGPKFIGKSKQQLIQELLGKKINSRVETPSEIKQQKHKVGEAGSFINQMMSNNSSLPVVGKGATEMLYSDRRCYEVIEVSEDGKTVKLEVLDAVYAGKKGEAQIGHQDWKFEPTGRYFNIVWRNGAWRTIHTEYHFTEEFRKSIPSPYISDWLRENNPELFNKVYADGIWPTQKIEGITKEVKSYPKIRIIFGLKDYHYDWTI